MTLARTGLTSRRARPTDRLTHPRVYPAAPRGRKP
jgi:hypothetical protein